MFMEELPETIYAECPECDDVMEHEILNGRLGKSGLTGTFKCTGCGRIFTGTIRLPRPFTVKAIVSSEETSSSTQTTVMENESPAVGDEFDLDDGRHVLITQIIDQKGAKRKSCPAVEVKELWVKDYGNIRVKVSVNSGRKTYPLYSEAEPDDEFAVGMIMNFDLWDAVITSIKTKTKLIRRGSAEARDITRVYAKIVRHGEEDSPETGDGVMDFDDE